MPRRSDRRFDSSLCEAIEIRTPRGRDVSAVSSVLCTYSIRTTRHDRKRSSSVHRDDVCTGLFVNSRVYVCVVVEFITDSGRDGEVAIFGTRRRDANREEAAQRPLKVRPLYFFLAIVRPTRRDGRRLARHLRSRRDSHASREARIRRDESKFSFFRFF